MTQMYHENLVVALRLIISHTFIGGWAPLAQPRRRGPVEECPPRQNHRGVAAPAHTAVDIGATHALAASYAATASCKAGALLREPRASSGASTSVA